MQKWMILTVLMLFSCGVTRKISQVGLRSVASIHERSELSELRAKVIQTSSFSSSCPAEVKELLPKLAAEYVRYPSCPEGLVDGLASVNSIFTLEERTLVEEVVNNQCRSSMRGEYGELLQQFIEDFDSTGPLARARKQSTNNQQMLQSLSNVQKRLEDMLRWNVSLDRWIELNGEFTLPEQELSFLYQLLVEEKCKLAGKEVDESYRIIRTLENLAKILPTGEQKSNIEKLLDGIHRVIEKKVKEFFYP